MEASGLERGHYIRKEILNSEPIVKRKMPDFEQSLYKEIQHQGNNINQIAKKLNTNEDFKQSLAAEANFAIKQLMKRILKNILTKIKKSSFCYSFQFVLTLFFFNHISNK